MSIWPCSSSPGTFLKGLVDLFFTFKLSLFLKITCYLATGLCGCNEDKYECPSKGCFLGRSKVLWGPYIREETEVIIDHHGGEWITTWADVGTEWGAELGH